MRKSAFGLAQLEALARLLHEPQEAFARALEVDTGLWSCDLTRDNALIWSPQVYDLFALGQDEPLTRSAAVSCYVPRSRVAMEALRAHAIHHRRGFTLDAMLRRHDGETRWMGLSAMPIVADGKVVRLAAPSRTSRANMTGRAGRGSRGWAPEVQAASRAAFGSSP